MSDRLAFRCKFCGELDSIVEVSLVPRVVGVVPDGEGGLDYQSRGWDDECYWEAETVLGYACTNESCEQWQGDVGAVGNLDDGNISVRTAITSPAGIAEVIS